ncbi:Remorin 4.1 [Linum perenne]
MPELASHLHHHHSSSTPAAGFGPRDASPDSVIFSLFSSTSNSVDRCSFASEPHNNDSFVSDFSSHLTASGGDGIERLESCSGPDHHRDPDRNQANAAAEVSALQKNKNKHGNQARVSSRKSDKVKAQKDGSNRAISAEEGEIQLLDSARSSFSLALKECQDRRSRSEAVAKKHDRRRPASLDLNNVVPASSPRLGAVKQTSISSSRKSGTFPSPGTPNYRHASVGLMQKGWSSERVPPLHAGGNRRQMSGAAFFPYNNGRALPSKWEDAERWIFSPVSGDGMMRTSVPLPHRRPKSKSGPLGPPGVAYYSLFSPAVPSIDGGNMRNFTVGSPFSAGVMGADGLTSRANFHGVAFPFRTEPCMARSVSVHGCSEMLDQNPSFPNQENRVENVKDTATDISRVVSRRDMATQMSPASSNHSSPSKRLSFTASSPPALPIVEMQSVQSSKSEVRDVQVDERVTVTRWSRKHRSGSHSKGSDIVDDWRKKVVACRSSAWEVSETTKSISKVQREEAKISAWENLQKAKAEAAIRKLEMKLEKKRSTSMDKIMNKLRSAQKKAQEMRSSVLSSQARQVSSTTDKTVSSFRRTRQMGTLSGCFTCHAF